MTCSAPPGVFSLADPSGLPAGHIEVTLKWKFSYMLPPGSIEATEEQRVEETSEMKLQQEDEEDEEDPCHPAASKVSADRTAG